MNDPLDLASVCAGDFDAALCFGPQRLDDGAGSGVLVARLLAATKPVAVIAPVHAYAPLYQWLQFLTFAQVRVPIDLIASGKAISLFHASQQASTTAA
jgi:DNA-binding transcriptional LysR family regulator